MSSTAAALPTSQALIQFKCLRYLAPAPTLAPNLDFSTLMVRLVCLELRELQPLVPKLGEGRSG
jgi:hypothetical protein